MDDEFREFEARNLDVDKGRGTQLANIRRDAISAVLRYNTGRCAVLLDSGHALVLIASYDEVNDWIMGRDAPVTLDAFRVKSLQD